MSKTSKVKSVKVSGSWEKDGVTYYNHNYEMEGGQKIQASHKTEKPFNEGDEVEYEVKRTHATWGDQGSVKKINNFNRGGGKREITVKLSEIKRMCRSNAIHAVNVVNAACGFEALDGKALSVIESFTLANIVDDVKKYSEQESNWISRLSSVNNAAIIGGVKNLDSGEKLVEEANKYYKYIIK